MFRETGACFKDFSEIGQNCPALNNLVRGPPQKIHTKFEAILCRGLREFKNVKVT